MDWLFLNILLAAKAARVIYPSCCLPKDTMQAILTSVYLNVLKPFTEVRQSLEKQISSAKHFIVFNRARSTVVSFRFVMFGTANRRGPSGVKCAE
ncbi:hypothetical protein BC629DRAFT_1530731 [Irpex lacteus]|nr:hypothetical protein BC629DRAFT_1530731 [Irpex lacteus]